MNTIINIREHPPSQEGQLSKGLIIVEKMTNDASTKTFHGILSVEWGQQCIMYYYIIKWREPPSYCTLTLTSPCGYTKSRTQLLLVVYV